MENDFWDIDIKYINKRLKEEKTMKIDFSKSKQSKNTNYSMKYKKPKTK